MELRRFGIAHGLIVTCLLALSGTSLAQRSGGTAGQISRMKPEVTISRGERDLPASASMKVQWNDEVKTGQQGLARIVLDDGSILTVSKNSSMHVRKDPEATRVHLAAGQMRAQVAKQSAGHAFELRTDTAVCGVLGTDFEVESSEEFTQVRVHEGQVRMTSGKTGRTQILNKGEVAHALKDGLMRLGLHPNATVETLLDLELREWKGLPLTQAEKAAQAAQERAKKNAAAKEAIEKGKEPLRRIFRRM